MKLLQAITFIGVVGSNGQFHWTDNGYAASAVGWLAAFLVTVIIIESLALCGRLLRALKHLRYQ